MAQLVGCWTHNPRVMGLIPTDANWFMWENILGKMSSWTVPLSTQGTIWVPSYMGYWLLCLAWQQSVRLPRLAILAWVILCKAL